MKKPYAWAVDRARDGTETRIFRKLAWALNYLDKFGGTLIVLFAGTEAETRAEWKRRQR